MEGKIKQKRGSPPVRLSAEDPRLLSIYLGKRYFFFFATGFFAAGFLAATFFATGFLVAHLPLVAHLGLAFFAAGFLTAFLVTFFAGAIMSSP
jgi:hypothetical protein